MALRILLVLLLWSLAASLPAVAKPPSRVVIGAGNAAGGYFLMAAAICEQINLGSPEHKLRCAVEPSLGTVANLEALRDGQIDLALAQSDWQHHAHAGTAARFAGDKNIPDMRALMSLTSSPLVLLARRDSGITGIDDLAGKRLDIGKPGSGRRAAADDVIAAQGWDLGNFKLASELEEAEAIAALCGGQIDVLALAGATPDKGVTAAFKACKLAPVPITGPVVKKLIADKPYYSAIRIPGGTYPGVSADTQSIGVRVILAASAKLSPAHAYVIARAVGGSLAALRRLHPSLASLNAREIGKASIAAPLHDGAARYYREAGL